MKHEHSTGHQACSAGYAVQASSAKFGLHAANVKLVRSMKNAGISVRVIMCVILPVCAYTHHAQ
jgi:hypothetical protein